MIAEALLMVTTVMNGERSFIPLFVTNLFGTARTREWARLTCLEFNRELEKWYNAGYVVGSDVS